MRLKTLFAGVAGLALCASVAEARDIPALADMEGSGEDGYWEYYEVTDADTLAAFQEIVGKPGETMANPPAEPVKIAFIYPSQDVSDFWLRNYMAMMARLEEMGVPAEDTQFASDVGDHIIQATYTDQVEQEDFDYVVFGPTELKVQQDNIKRLIDKPDTEVIVWNFTVVPQAWGSTQPLAYLSFSHLAGALIMCDYVLGKLGKEGTMALVRGIPGAIDDQRSGGFKDCVTSQSNWQVAYEHVGMFERERGYTGTQQILQAYPEVRTHPQRQHRDGDGIDLGGSRGRQRRQGHGLGRHGRRARGAAPRRALGDADAHERRRGGRDRGGRARAPGGPHGRHPAGEPRPDHHRERRDGCRRRRRDGA